MLKPIAAMTDHEMLLELMQEKRRNDRSRKIRYMIAGAVIVLTVILLIRFLPPAVSYFRTMKETIDRMQASVTEIQNAADSIRNTIGDMWNRFSTLLHWGTSGGPI